MQTADAAGNTVLEFTRHLDTRNNVIAEYVWIDGASGLRGKARTLAGISEITSLDQIPEWNFDGSSCYQAPTKNSEIIMKPVAFFPDPFRGAPHILVLCESFSWTDTTYTVLQPANTNFRHFAKQIWDSNKDEEPWYGIEQEYTLLKQHNRFSTQPYGWPLNGFPGPQGPYYCSVGGNCTFGRTIADAHYKCCLYAGIKISGINAEVMPGQWEFQVGPCLAEEIGDHMWMARYILGRVAEDYSMIVSFEPKLYADWNGSGCHTNFSTKTMRAGTGGMKYITDMMERFRAKHVLHMEVYGDDNHKRLTGHHETSSWKEFSYGTGNRGASFRIPTATTHANGKGYIEDRRPASNIDPYVVGAIMYDTAVLDKPMSEGLMKHFRAWKEELKTMVIEKA